jgi:hypothetical protein
MKVQYALSTLADSVALRIREQGRGAVRKRGKQIFRLAWFEPQLRRWAASTRPKPGAHWVARHQPIEFINRGVMNGTPALPGQDLLSQLLS